jgi:hypothetical protein
MAGRVDRPDQKPRRKDSAYSIVVRRRAFLRDLTAPLLHKIWIVSHSIADGTDE